MKKNVGLNELNTIFLETYLELLLAANFYILYPSYQSSSELINYISAICCFVFTLFVIPCMFVYVSSRPLEAYDQRRFSKRWMAFYEGLKL
jgi:hypothetical protein